MTQRLLLTLSEGIDRIGTRVASAAPAASFKSAYRPCDLEFGGDEAKAKVRPQYVQ